MYNYDYDCFGEFNPYNKYCLYRCPYSHCCEEWTYDNGEWWW